MYRTPALLRPFKRYLLPTPAREAFVVRASDGIELAVRVVRAAGASRGPVMLLHGLASNASGWDVEGRSLAGHLAARGFDCYLPELRGHGRSDRPSYSWDLDDYLTLDLPALIDAIVSRADGQRLHWVGHSMGGVLLFCYGALNRGAPLASGIALGSALDYRVGKTGFRGMLALRPLLERIPALPYGVLMHLLAPAMGRGWTPFERFNVWNSNIEPELCRAIHASAFHTIPVSLLASLATNFEPGGLRNRDGSVRFVESARDFPFPALLCAASRDQQVSVEAVRHTAELLGPRAEARVYGTRSGHADEYGHWDLLIGRRAEREVWPDLSDWLVQHSRNPAETR